MPNADHKMKLLYMIQIFQDYTDKNHPISMSQLLDKLEERMGTRPDRKTIYSDLDALTMNGIKIHREPSGKSYYLEERDFSFNDVRTIVDCVAASKYLSAKQARAIIEKCKGLVPEWERTKLMRQVFVQNRSRTDNDEARDEMEKIFQAIQEHKQISFSYFDYDLAKHRKYRYDGDIKVISPWAVLYDNDFYYLLAYGEGKMKNYRVDHMEGVEIEPTDALGKEAFDEINLEEYTKQTFGMFGGKVERVTLRFHNRMIGTVLDKFGKGVVLHKVDNEHFRVTVSVVASTQFYGWVFGLKNFVTIEGPQNVVDGMKDMLAAVGKRYD